MGTKSVTSLQYNEQDLDEALTHVDIDLKSGHAIDDLPKFSAKFSHDTSTIKKKNEKGDSKPSVDEDLSSALSNADIGLGVRRRNIPGVEEVSDGGAEDDKKKGQRGTAAGRDPIRWFGILVPGTLRQSQQSFRHGVEIVCDIATLQSDLIDIRTRYLLLMKEKRALVESAKETTSSDLTNSS